MEVEDVKQNKIDLLKSYLVQLNVDIDEFKAFLVSNYSAAKLSDLSVENIDALIATYAAKMKG